MLAGTHYKTPQEVDLQFDLINHYWDSTAFLDFIVTRSALARQELEVVEDIRVGTLHEERIDVFPAARSNSPILIFVHGGWWRGGTRKMWSFPASGFVKRGYTVIISDYALCPKVGIPDISNATRAAVVWAFENAATINGNRNRIFLAGHSAGGQQAGMMAVTNWADFGITKDVLKGVVPMSGVFDMREFQSCWLQPYLQLTGDTVRSESAIFNIPETAPPLLVMLGEEEAIGFHRQAEAFTEAWRSKGHRADYFAVHGEDHATSVYQLADPQSAATEMLVDFFKTC